MRQIAKGYLIQLAMTFSDCLDWSMVLVESQSEELTCSICLQFMSQPYRLSCSQQSTHVFGFSCIKEWEKKGVNGKKCPLCRSLYQQYSLDSDRALRASNILVKCKYCSVIFKAPLFVSHLHECQKLQQQLKNKLNGVLIRQRQLLQKQINPHLRSAHSQIFNSYVKDWNWLSQDPRDWKWWWWASNLWWNGQSCGPCNVLWHKYEQEIDPLEEKRVSYLCKIYKLGKKSL